MLLFLRLIYSDSGFTSLSKDLTRAVPGVLITKRPNHRGRLVNIYMKGYSCHCLDSVLLFQVVLFTTYQPLIITKPNGDHAVQ